MSLFTAVLEKEGPSAKMDSHQKKPDLKEVSQNLIRAISYAFTNPKQSSEPGPQPKSQTQLPGPPAGLIQDEFELPLI